MYSNLTSLNEALLNAARDGNSAKFSNLMQCREMDINTVDPKSGNSPLSVSTRNGQTAIVKLILSHSNVDVNTWKIKRYGDNILHITAFSGYHDIAELILKHGQIDVHHVNNYGATPLRAAQSHGHHDIASLIRHYLENEEL